MSAPVHVSLPTQPEFSSQRTYGSVALLIVIPDHQFDGTAGPSRSERTRSHALARFDGSWSLSTTVPLEPTR